jgi:hypothetical protein
MSRCFFASGSGATSAPGRYAMDFAQSADTALQRISDAAGASLIDPFRHQHARDERPLNFCRRRKPLDRMFPSL